MCFPYVGLPVGESRLTHPSKGTFAPEGKMNKPVKAAKGLTKTGRHEKDRLAPAFP
jgi:hypothetical protein